MPLFYKFKNRYIFKRFFKKQIQTQGGTMPEETASPFDTSAEQGELDALSAELEQNAASIESDFAKYAAETLSAEDEELFFEDKEAFIMKILQMQNEYLESNIRPKEARANELSQSIESKKQLANFDEAVKAFSQNHPEVDVNELFDFLENDLPPRVKKELESINEPMEFLETLFAIYSQNGAQGEQGQQDAPQEQDLPKQVQGVSKQADMAGHNQPLPQDRF